MILVPKFSPFDDVGPNVFLISHLVSKNRRLCTIGHFLKIQDVWGPKVQKIQDLEGPQVQIKGSGAKIAMLRKLNLPKIK